MRGQDRRVSRWAAGTWAAGGAPRPSRRHPTSTPLCFNGLYVLLPSPARALSLRVSEAVQEKRAEEGGAGRRKWRRKREKEEDRGGRGQEEEGEDGQEEG